MRVTHIIKTEGHTAGLSTYTLFKLDKLQLFTSTVNLARKH